MPDPKQRFIDANINKPELMQRYPNYKVRRNEVERMFEQQQDTSERATIDDVPEPEAAATADDQADAVAQDEAPESQQPGAADAPDTEGEEAERLDAEADQCEDSETGREPPT